MIKKSLFFLVFIVGSYSISAQDKDTISKVIDEVVIKAAASQNLEGKVWDMGEYYYCKFTKDDERMAVLDGYIVLSPSRIEEIRNRAAKEHNVQFKDVAIISGRDTKEYGTYELCAGGVKYIYIRRGGGYTYYKKVK